MWTRSKRWFEKIRCHVICPVRPSDERESAPPPPLLSLSAPTQLSLCLLQFQIVEWALSWQSHSTEIDHVMNCIFDKLLSAFCHKWLESQTFSEKCLCSMKIANFKASPLKCTPTDLSDLSHSETLCGGRPLVWVGVCVRLCTIMWCHATHPGDVWHWTVITFPPFSPLSLE